MAAGSGRDAELTVTAEGCRRRRGALTALRGRWGGIHLRRPGRARRSGAHCRHGPRGGERLRGERAQTLAAIGGTERGRECEYGRSVAFYIRRLARPRPPNGWAEWLSQNQPSQTEPGKQAATVVAAAEKEKKKKKGQPCSRAFSSPCRPGTDGNGGEMEYTGLQDYRSFFFF